MNDDQLTVLVSVLAWGLTQAGQRWITSPQWRHAIPGVALALGIGIRAGVEASLGQPLTGAVLLSGIVAGLVAVGGHVSTSQARRLASSTDRE